MAPASAAFSVMVQHFPGATIGRPLDPLSTQGAIAVMSQLSAV
jgi:hypothetical protein